MKKILTVIAVIALFFVGFGFIFGTHDVAKEDTKKTAEVKKTAAVNNSEKVKTIDVPTLFLHGYSGTKNSMGHMMDRLASNGDATRSLVVSVTPEGAVNVTGDWDKFAKNPLIQVLFEDNKSSLTNQTVWLQNVMLKLKSEYHIPSANVVGHSMGGVDWTGYLEEVGNKPDFPTVKKFVAIGSPFNGLEIGKDGKTAYDLTETGPATQTERFANFMTNKKVIPATLEVLNIAGDVEDGTKSDTSVSLASALSGKFIFDQVASYKELTFTGKQAQHSKLHENKDVDAAVSDFLWPSS
ncbi:alpha/beta hydrolase [Listeria booriae]|uniref:Alpha/beta hydrolase n=1 Tax=Listeria booriae TaxID=1552123 RepID=A0A7X0XA36_9LIST|nr:alpha/beta hydrolase [Listeria booriae]MBC1490362.1 alpha/beta hydrolase [Listeria booriae]MBC1503966.1 alpha/beta hydrolase [Listeria booriae]MBC1523090.1 alpha/beta hydrolase [Listeria booriae]